MGISGIGDDGRLHCYDNDGRGIRVHLSGISRLWYSLFGKTLNVEAYAVNAQSALKYFSKYGYKESPLAKQLYTKVMEHELARALDKFDVEVAELQTRAASSPEATRRFVGDFLKSLDTYKMRLIEPGSGTIKDHIQTSKKALQNAVKNLRHLKNELGELAKIEDIEALRHLYEMRFNLVPEFREMAAKLQPQSHTYSFVCQLIDKLSKTAPTQKSVPIWKNERELLLQILHADVQGLQGLGVERTLAAMADEQKELQELTAQYRRARGHQEWLAKALDNTLERFKLHNFYCGDLRKTFEELERARPKLWDLKNPLHDLVNELKKPQPDQAKVNSLVDSLKKAIASHSII